MNSELLICCFSFLSHQKKLLQLWTELSNRQPWSLTKSLPSIDADLAKIRYPSTTARPPRSIMKCLKLKANECRVLLLICYPVFKKYLPEINYKHLQKLAFGITIGESSNIVEGKVEEMEMLLDSFVDEFPYHQRYIVQTVHCVKHFARTTMDFGPLSNYSTFNFESVIGIKRMLFTCYFPEVDLLGCLSASIHGTRQLGSELALNLSLFKQASFVSSYHCLSSVVSHSSSTLNLAEQILLNSKRRAKLFVSAMLIYYVA